jgi:hypothetical protein
LRNLPRGEVYRYPFGLWLPDGVQGQWERIEISEWDQRADGTPRTPNEIMQESNRRNVAALLAAIEEDRAPRLASSGRDALAALEMVFAPVVSQRLGRRVTFPPEHRGSPYASYA